MNRKKETTYIYALKDPRDNCVWYVGKSDKPTYRYHQHMYDTTSNRYKARWMKGLLNSGHKPILVLLEKVEADLWLEAERHWLDLGYRRGWPLTNIVMYEGNKGDPIVLDEELDEAMWDYLPEKMWNVFCGYSEERKAQITRAVALTMAELSTVSINARGQFKFMYDPHLGFYRGVDMARNLVGLNDGKMDKALKRVDERANLLMKQIDNYMVAKHGP